MSIAETRSFRFGSAVVMATLTAGVIAGCSKAPAPGSPSPVAAAAAADVKGEPGLGPDLAAVRAATAQFHDVQTAIAAGYMDPAVGHCDEIDIGAMGVHSANAALLGSQVLDPLKPEVMLYLPKQGGGFRLVGVEYVQPVLLRNPATGAVAPWFAPTPWPAGYQVVTPTPALFGHTFQGPMPGHVPGMPWHWDLHAWIWANNPNGTFEQWNPALSCQ